MRAVYRETVEEEAKHNKKTQMSSEGNSAVEVGGAMTSPIRNSTDSLSLTECVHLVSEKCVQSRCVCRIRVDGQQKRSKCVFTPETFPCGRPLKKRQPARGLWTGKRCEAFQLDPRLDAQSPPFVPGFTSDIHCFINSPRLEIRHRLYFHCGSDAE